jgi:hypothetical protein
MLKMLVLTDHDEIMRQRHCRYPDVINRDGFPLTDEARNDFGKLLGYL